MIRVVAALLLCLTQIAMSAFEKTPQGSRSIGMGGALVAAPNNAWAVYSNPGVLSTVSGRTVSLFYSPRPFEMKELAHGSFSYVEPTAIGAFALSGSRFGFELYREVVATVSYANSFYEDFHVGININYYSLTIQNYGTGRTVGLDLGLLVDVSENVSWGVAAFNVTAPTIGVEKERLPQVYSTGVSYRPIPDAVLAAEVAKDIRYPAEFHLGIEYTLLDLIDLRVGSTSDPSTLNAGVGIRYSILQLDYAFSSHVELGMTHQVSLSLKLGDL